MGNTKHRYLEIVKWLWIAYYPNKLANIFEYVCGKKWYGFKEDEYPLLIVYSLCRYAGNKVKLNKLKKGGKCCYLIIT